MRKRVIQLLIMLILVITLSATFNSCKKGPKVIAEPVATQPTSNSGIFEPKGDSGPATDGQASTNLHSVVALETRDTEKYTYIKVREGSQEYWVATGKKDITPGASYYYSSSIRKTNFESKEFGRVFDEIFLIGNIVPANHGNEIRKEGVAKVDVETHSTSDPVQSNVSSGPGEEITILTLVNNPSNFENKRIQLKGTVEKVNSNIMGRNWIHLKDGSMDEYDLVITSKESVAEGNVIMIEGKVSLDVDFGAGYRYDIIVEDARIF